VTDLGSITSSASGPGNADVDLAPLRDAEIVEDLVVLLGTL